LIVGVVGNNRENVGFLLSHGQLIGRGNEHQGMDRGGDIRGGASGGVSAVAVVVEDAADQDGIVGVAQADRNRLLLRASVVGVADGYICEGQVVRIVVE